MLGDSGKVMVFIYQFLNQKPFFILSTCSLYDVCSIVRCMGTAGMATLCQLLNPKTLLVVLIAKDSLSHVLILLLVRFVTLTDSKRGSIKHGLIQGTANAITHNSSDDKDSITVVWTPPSAMSGEVVFQVNCCTIWLSWFYKINFEPLDG